MDMKKLVFLFIFCSFSTFGNAGNEDLLRGSTDNPFEVFGVSKRNVADAIQIVYQRMSDRSELVPNMVDYIYSVNAALKEGIPQEYFQKVPTIYFDESPRFVYSLSFPQLLDIWAAKKTSTGPAFWQLMANVLHADLYFYETNPHEDNSFEAKAKAIARSHRVGGKSPRREYHIGVIRTEAGNRYLPIILGKRLKMSAE
jgi:hypothetical protein